MTYHTGHPIATTATKGFVCDLLHTYRGDSIKHALYLTLFALQGCGKPNNLGMLFKFTEKTSIHKGR